MYKQAKVQRSQGKSDAWGHEAHIGQIRENTTFQSENARGRDHLGDIRMILKWILQRYDVRVWNGFM
jgi:hypothetical protein